ncbi:MAG TPA: FAD-dependent oxidoreductase [Ornithinimicrobium sp.]|uniref:NAD(P)/FAD-dependent oxidoreductase n=1 Tax=Ornithinimicrobium sp. TaxID=1977084 RepID=UPI002B47617E|nr:FAD-dependent oxidoreductase [Ornithinimicrobium sp.]HKJ11407.1 FAD-dependent oxidoreductase [Ornithinimicrobium sp.]
MSRSRAPVLLLVGAGHAHLHLLVQAERLAHAGYEVHLLAPSEFRYSGVASASATGALPADAGAVDIAALVASGQVRHHPARLVGLDLAARRATASDGSTITWDVLSLNVGSVAGESGLDVADGTVRVKPLTELAGLGRRIEDAAVDSRPARVSVVGAGPSGLELAGHLSARGDAEVLLVEADPRTRAGLPHGAHAAVVALLRGRGVAVRTGVEVGRVESFRLAMRDGSEHRHDVAVLATGLVAPAWLADLGLSDPESANAGVPVRGTLQHRDRTDVYATGDCADFMPRALPKLGVYGVRQGPVLLRSLLARAAGEPLPQYTPQPTSLQVLDLGADVGLAVRGNLWWLGRLSLRLKRHIDGRWLRRLR